VRGGGTDGNRRLTASNAAVLLVLLAAEGASIPFIGPYPNWHILLGFALIPPVALKLASVSWRFARYYLRQPDYLRAGPPHPIMRFVVAPVTVLSTITLFASGVLLIALHKQEGPIVGLHKASFVVWFVAMSAHVLWHLPQVARLARGTLDVRLPGARARQLLLTGALAAGLGVAIAAVPAANHWGAQHAFLRGSDR
jgi:hypothetical protein